MTWNAFHITEPAVNDGFSSHSASNAEFCVFFAVSLHKLMYKQTTELPLIKDAMALMWLPCNVIVTFAALTFVKY